MNTQTRPSDPPSMETAVQTHLEAARRIGLESASPNAADVDRKARFPHEAITGLKSEKLLGAYVPIELGGLGCGIADLAAMCTALGQQCASTGMVFAMHQIQVACMVRHGLSSPFFRDYLAELAQKQYLVASVTSEAGVGGDTRTSLCAVERRNGRFVLSKDATTISYGEDADALLATCRRAPEAAGSDQVLVLLKQGDYALTRTSSWDTLGMRGTHSPGYRVIASGSEEQIVPGSFADSSSQTMVPFSHILWSAVWLGVAEDAVARARAFVRAEARRTPGSVPPTAVRLAELSVVLQTLRSHLRDVTSETDRLLRAPDGNESVTTLGFALKMNNLKISSSNLTVEIVQKAMLICGIAAYKNDSEFSLGRQLRDAHSAALMIGNDRILAKSASMLLVFRDE